MNKYVVGLIVFWSIFTGFLIYGIAMTPVKDSYVSSEIIYKEMIPDEFKSTVERIHLQYGFSYQLIFKLVNTESRWKKYAVGFNSNGTKDQGLCQLNSGNNWTIDPMDGEQNLLAGFKYLDSLVKQFGDMETALMAYNCGPGNVARGTIPERSRSYARGILNARQSKD